MRLALALILTLASAALAGCGGGSADRLSQAEFVSRADAICRKYEERLDALGQPTNVTELRSFAERALPIARAGREELAELRPPKNRQETYDAWLAEGARAIEIVERLRDAAAENDPAEIQRIGAAAQATDRESNRLAAELGFRQCGGADATAP